MPDPGRAARRLAAAALIALALTAAAGVVDNPASASPRSATLPKGAPPPAGPGAARLPAGEGADPPDSAGPLLRLGAQALFSAGLLVEVDPLPSDDDLAVVSAGFLALSPPRSPSDLAGLPRESVR